MQKCKHCGKELIDKQEKLYHPQLCWFKPQNAPCTTCLYGYKTFGNNRLCLTGSRCRYSSFEASDKRKIAIEKEVIKLREWYTNE